MYCTHILLIFPNLVGYKFQNMCGNLIPRCALNLKLKLQSFLIYFPPKFPSFLSRSHVLQFLPLCIYPISHLDVFTTLLIHVS